MIPNIDKFASLCEESVTQMLIKADDYGLTGHYVKYSSKGFYMKGHQEDVDFFLKENPQYLRSDLFIKIFETKSKSTESQESYLLNSFVPSFVLICLFLFFLCGL